ncbi:hypothetical protein GCM10023321_50610 [Pseudonocardia eucalypti]|uniref:Uncharacterized protein n=1 Tax=Pseudonocardia eucalypti TaxID=648755 RepID=A0ABP9QKL5_9PSEU
MTAVALPVTAHPPVPAVQPAWLCEAPGRPEVTPAALAVQPGPAHWAAAEDSDQVVGSVSGETGLVAASVACWAVRRAWSAALAASLAACFCASVAPGRAAAWAAWSAACCACAACWVACCAVLLLFSVTMSATTWPAPAIELEVAWQAAPVVSQVLVVVPVAWLCSAGGPWLPVPPLLWSTPVIPVAELCAVPLHRPLPSQFRVAQAEVQLDAPGTDGPPELALAPGAVAGWVGCWPG